jgi:hypothetical protein
VLNRFVMIAGILTISSGVGLAAGRQPRPTQQSPTTTPTHTSAERKVNLEGCVFRNRAMSAALPTSRSKGSGDDYIVADTKAISASPGLTVSDGKVFRLDQVDQDKLRELIGRRALVSGRVDDKSEPAVLQVISIIETVGSCPAAPTPHS